MRTLEEIDTEIKETKTLLQNVKGTATEVYARIVGYYRSTRNFNPGKAQEYKERLLFSPTKGVQEHLKMADIGAFN